MPNSSAQASVVPYVMLTVISIIEVMSFLLNIVEAIKNGHIIRRTT